MTATAIVACAAIPTAPARAERATSVDMSTAARRVVARFARRRLPDWRSRGKIQAPRIALAKLMRGRQAERVNAYLRAATPWSEPGSTWGFPSIGLGHRGDYDFTLVTLIEILYRFDDRPARLAPATRRHLVETLLAAKGGDPRTAVPGTGGWIGETENHVLMTEGSRYLTNQWLHRHGTASERAAPRYDNGANGLRSWLRRRLRRLRETGFYEFNAIPYEGYAIQALANLAAYARPKPVAEAAERLLDGLFWRAALGSLGLRRCVPFRRQYHRALHGRLDLHSATAYLTVYAGDPHGRLEPGAPAPPRLHEMLVAAAVPYAPPADAIRAALRRGPWAERSWFLRIGHGPGASPEILAAGPGYLLSAGGSARPGVHPVRARPTVLLLAGDGARRLEGCFRIPGAGRPGRWNNTGVHRGIAVGAAPVRVPDGAEPRARAGRWRLYVHHGSRNAVWIAVYNAPDHPDGPFGLLAVRAADHGSAEAWLDRLRAANPDERTLRRRIRRPSAASLRYDVDAPRSEWVIRAVDGEAVERSFDQWPVWPRQRAEALARIRGRAVGKAATSKPAPRPQGR